MIHSFKRYLRERAGGYFPYRSQLKANGDAGIRLLNWWTEDNATRLWLRRFIESRGLAKGKTVDICSIFGPRAVLGWSEADCRIFFSGENLHLPRWAHYADYMLTGSRPFNLALGFDEFEDPSYLRFPLWILYLFPPDSTGEDVARICARLRYPQGNTGEKFCALVSRWDPNGVRGRIHDALREFGRIDCPSGFRHNDDSLKDRFADDKHAYLSQYMFNICPENSNAFGYTTEKLFESINAGCIPVYWGSCGMPEPQVINPDAVLLWDERGGNDDLVRKVGELTDNPRAYADFCAQPRLLDGAEEWIGERLEELENKLK